MTGPVLLAIGVSLLTMGTGLMVYEGARTRAIVRSATMLDGRGPGARVRLALDRPLARTRLGIGLRVAADEFGLLRARPVDLLAAILAVMGLVYVLVGQFLSWNLAPVFALLVAPAAAYVVHRERQQRREKFIAQMPQLARVLSNATAAGLSLRTSIEIASEEMSEPVHSEMGRVAQALSFGDSLERALGGLEERLPSRDVVVLVSTLIVSARSGGSLISALRRIAETLDERKQTRREILTALAEARSTALLIPVIGIGSLLLVRTLDANAIDEMLSRTVGQVIFVITAVMYAIGAFLFLRVTKVSG